MLGANLKTEPEQNYFLFYMKPGINIGAIAHEFVEDRDDITEKNLN